MTSIRSFQLSDYAAVTQLLNEVLSEKCFEETISAFARQLSLDSELVLVAENQGSVIGIIIGTIDNNNGYYYRIAVDAACRRQGIGKSLIRSLKRRFDSRNVSRVAISMDEHNAPVAPLYRSLGIDIDAVHSQKPLRIVYG